VTSAEVQRKVDDLAAELGRSVVITDPETRLLYSSPHFGDEDDIRVQAVLRRSASSAAVGHVLAQGVQSWTRLGRIPPAPGLGMRSRLCAPVRWRGELLGLVMVIDERHDLPSAGRRRIEDLATEVAALLIGERRAARAATAEDEHQVAALVGADPAARRQALAAFARREEVARASSARVTVVEAVALAAGVDRDRVDAALRHALDAVRSRHRGTVLAAVRDGRAVQVQLTSGPVDDRLAVELARRLVHEVAEFAADGFGSRAGVGSAGPGIGHARTSHRQAELACRGVPVLGRGPVARWEELGPLQVLLRIPPGELDETAVPEALRALAAADPQGRLRGSLAAYLACGGNVPAAAVDLAVHRTTLYYRLDRIREITGLDLDDGETRLTLHLGLAVQRLREAALRQGEEERPAASDAGIW
jgi:sugar diacid utilization regulator